MDKEKSLIIGFAIQTLITFAAAVIAVSVVGWFKGDVTKETVGLLALGREGLSYASLFQVFIFSLTTACIKALLFSGFAEKKMMLLWRTVLMFLLSFVSAVVLSVLFQWFPIESREAWLGFFLSIAVCFTVCIILMIVKTKLEDKKYGKLLSDYKVKQNRESGEL